MADDDNRKRLKFIPDDNGRIVLEVYEGDERIAGAAGKDWAELFGILARGFGAEGFQYDDKLAAEMRIHELVAQINQLRKQLNAAKDNGKLLDSFFAPRVGGALHEVLTDETSPITFAEAFAFITQYVEAIETLADNARKQRSDQIMKDIAANNRVERLEEDLGAALWLINRLTNIEHIKAQKAEETK